MPGPDEAASEQPILQPRVIRFIKDRPRLVDKGVRREFWEHVEENVRERRKPDTAAEKMVQRLFRETADAAAPTARDRIRDRLESANEGVLENL